MSEINEHTLPVRVGLDCITFCYGDYLNAINQVTCYFQAQREQTDPQLAAALRLYADMLGDQR